MKALFQRVICRHMLSRLFKFFPPHYLQLTGEQKIGEDPRDDVIRYVHYALLHNKPPQIQWLTTMMYYAPDSALMWAVLCSLWYG